MPPKQKRRIRRSRGSRRSMAMVQYIPRPPSYRGSNSEIRVYRFQRTYVVNAGLETYALSPTKFGFLTSICTTQNSLVTGWWETVQLFGISMWANPPSDGSSVFVSIIANNGTGVTGQAGDDVPATGTSSGMTITAYAKKRFTPKMQAGQPQSCITTNNNAMVVLSIASNNPNAANGVVSSLTIDIFGRFTASNDARSSSNTLSIASGILSNIYYMALDNTAGGNLAMSNLLKPDYTLSTTT